MEEWYLFDDSDAQTHKLTSDSIFINYKQQD